jgi:RNA methyltransferase, TrmH family
MIKSITSPVNPLIKKIGLLSEKVKARNNEGLFVVEGRREVGLAILGGYLPKTMIFNPTIVTYNQLFDLYGKVLFDIEMIEVTNLVYNKIAYREGTEGVITLFETKQMQLDDLVFKNDHPLIIVAEGLEKPGNIGALLRTADAAGVDAFIIANANADIYNPNIIRSSLGTLFTNTLAVASTEDVIQYLKVKNISIYCAAITERSQHYFAMDYTSASAIVVGAEADGLTDAWLSGNFEEIIIPMHGKVDSINVSVSAGIILYEAVRQKSTLK